MSDEVRLSFPVFVIISQPYRLSEGYGGAKFANFVTEGYEDCFAIFHHEVEAEEFIKYYGLERASVVEIKDEPELWGTFKHAKRIGKFTRAGWTDPKSEGGVCTFRI